MRKTPKGLRLQIAIFGRRNVGKSSLLNCLTAQEVSIVSSSPGTTTDPVEKPMELLPIGPVLFIDTAGLDDEGELGRLRVEKTARVFERADIILLITEAWVWTDFEEKILQEAGKRNTPVLVILNKIDTGKFDRGLAVSLERKGVPYLKVSCLKKTWEVTAGIKNRIIDILPADWMNPIPIISDLIEEDDLVVLVIPIDKEAPRGRLIFPQQQTIREILDKKANCLITDQRRLLTSLNNLKKRPRAVITDSQVFKEVFEITPRDIPVSSFSILFARSKGDLEEFVRSVRTIDGLNSQDRILIAEACTHHPIGDDIGRIKIPRWIAQRTGCRINFDVYSGHDFPRDLDGYKLIIHCGSCMLNRKETLSRIYQAKSQRVAITNYGIAIAYLHQNLERGLEIFSSFQRS
jgi:[FeFe] hydrogenase H-cluster maturation GTPase HydF